MAMLKSRRILKKIKIFLRPILTYADEAHHSGAESYRKIMEYFQPDFWLGMTASPETNRFDVYEIFDHNIAYEIRLQQALEEDLLCPFHYFGITDLSIDGEVIGDEDSADGLRNFNRLTSDYSGSVVKTKI